METRKPEAAKLVPKKRSPPKTSPSKSSAITDALLLLQQQGFTVIAPDLTAQDEAKTNAASALGVIQHDDYVPEKKKVNVKKEALTITLAFPHSINGVVYGPGTITLTPSKVNLLQSLAHKDQLAKEQEARVFENTSRCHLIVSRTDSLGRQAAYAQTVDERYFNTGAALMQAPVFQEFSSSDIRH